MSKKHIIIAGAGLALWLAETAYFGFNAKPSNGLEATLDLLSTILILWGIIGDILSGVTIQKREIINTQDLRYYDQRGAKEKTEINVPEDAHR